MRISNSLILGSDRSLYRGELPATDWHSHAAPVLLIGLSGRFVLRLGQGRTESCHSAWIDSGVAHVFDSFGEQVATMYLEPDAVDTRRWRAHFANHGGIVLDPCIPVQGRSSMDAYLRNFDLDALLPFDRAVVAPMDARVAYSVNALRRPGMAPPGRGALAQATGLSESRFNHLFRAEMGVSFRSYRVWSQVRGALGALGTDRRLTQAALEGGFVDSSHFSHMFRKTFGMTPSSVLKPLRDVTLV
jgi:AraC-like DNA-binding protein